MVGKNNHACILAVSHNKPAVLRPLRAALVPTHLMHMHSLMSSHSLALLLQVSYASSSETLSNRERFPSFFRTVPSDARTVAGIVSVVEEFGWSRAAIITEDESPFKAVRISRL